MGCNIDFHVELKIDGRWQHYKNPEVPRNYQLFAKMAGVRSHENNEFDPISEPKGLPEKISEILTFCVEYAGSDGHSHSWLQGQEIVDLSHWIDEQGWTQGKYNMEEDESTLFGYLFGSTFAGFYEYPDSYINKSGIIDIRYVFWFNG